MNLEELRKQLAEAHDEINKLVDDAKVAKRSLSKEEGDKFDELEGKIKDLKANIVRAEKHEELQKERVKPVTKPVEIQVTRNEGENENGDCKVWSSVGEQLRAVIAIEKQPTATATKHLREKMDLSNKIMRAATGMNESIAADGGALVQKDFADVLLDKAYLKAPFAGRAKRLGLSTNANGIKLPYIDESSRVDGSRQGGIQMYWEEEGATFTATKTKIGVMELNTKKLIGAVYLTDELMEDASVLGQWVQDGFQREMAFKLDDACINGNGAGKPLGVLNCGALVTVSKESGQAANTLNAINFAKMFARFIDASLANGVWLYNLGTKAQIMTLSLTVGSNTYPVMIPGGLMGSMAGSVPVSTILGLPALGSEHCAALSSAGDVILADPSNYIIVDKGGMKSASSIHVRFLQEETVLRFSYRVDGQPTWRLPLTPYKGSDTLSPFVTLQAR